jgi:polyferredoxin
MKRYIHRAIQLAFLALFVILILKGKVQAWAGLLLLGIAASFLFGRIYCGWICSINTALAGVTWVKKKLHIKSAKIPKLLSKSWVRYLALSLFIALFIFTAMAGKKLPILPALFVIGILVTFIYPEELWHRYLCHYGTMLQLSATKSKHGMQIDESLCNNCGTCRSVCSAKSVVKSEEKHMIQQPDCLVCMKCETRCKKGAISYS